MEAGKASLGGILLYDLKINSRIQRNTRRCFGFNLGLQV